MNELSVNVEVPRAHFPPMGLAEARAKVHRARSQFLLRRPPRAEEHNLVLGANRVTAFIGPSGCGKSTLLRIFNRMYDLYPGQRAEGAVLLDDTNILDPRIDLNLLRARIGMVFQKPTPFPMTIYENIAFGIRLYEKISKSEMDGRVEAALRAGALWTEVKNKLNAQRAQACPAASSSAVHRPHRPPCARGHPVRRAVLRRPTDLHRPDRGADPGAQGGLYIAIVTITCSRRRACADKPAFMYLGELIEFDDTSKLFTSPADRRTQDYITGRFG